MAHLKNTDISIPFVLPFFALRGRLVRLQEVNTAVLSQHTYPFPIEQNLTELLAASATLSGLLKYEGVFTLQTKTSGPIGMTVIDVTHEGHIRGYAQFNPKKIQKQDTFQHLFGRGYLAFTVDQGLKVERYQGIVALEHETLPQALEHYFDQSEQLKTRLFILSQKTDQGIWKSSALLLQQMPAQEVNEDTWTHIEALLNTLSVDEFLDFSILPKTLLTRLFFEVGVTVFSPQPLQAKCRCSKSRIKAFLKTLTPEEIESLLENGQLKMTCEFCNHKYAFDRKDLMTVH